MVNFVSRVIPQQITPVNPQEEHEWCQMYSQLTQRVQKVALFSPDPQVVIARHKEHMLELLDHDLECAPQNSLVI